MLLIQLPLIEYNRALVIQKAIVQKKVSIDYPDVLLILEHPPTVTLGTRGKRTDLLVSEECLRDSGIDLYSVDRGGEATYHGPGQVVCYPIVDLKSLKISVREYVRRLEDTVIAALNELSVAAFRLDGKIGVWTGRNHKIASVGIRITRRIAFHGFSVNVDLQTNPAQFIVSCGMPDVVMVSVNDMTQNRVSMKAAKEAIARSFATEFRVDLEPCSLEQVLP